ncbi:MAG TPA: mismatch-specific DNA-glycosylase [Paracoccaceae bacterium]|nr:mismatch-specific DNA-glycosylase [Paracoccaceae bacterium]HMO73121.1 mismatch-specific DNA-glycosylase [Paracoccaceae bacterium]
MILPDHLAPGLDLVFCGTAPGRASARAGHYYANPGNRFWALLHVTGLTPRQLAPQEDAALPALGIGLTDLCKTRAGQDADLAPADFDVARLIATVAVLCPRALAFTSLTAARVALGRVAAGRLPADPRLPGIALFALPSPSGLARSHFRIEPWEGLAAFLGRPRGVAA